MRSRLLPLVYIMISIAIFFAYINPVYTGPIAQTQSAIASDDSALSAAQNYSRKETELVAARNAIPQDQLDRLASFLPDSVDNVRLILDLNALAQKTGVILTGVTVNAPAPVADVTSASTQGTQIGHVDLVVNTTGTYTAFRSFLAGIEGSLRLLDIVNLSVQGSDARVYNYSTTIRIYWLR